VIRRLGSLLEPFEAIDLGELDAMAALQDRVDRKYLLDLPLLESFLDRLVSSHRLLVLEHGRWSRYSSVYFDTADLLCHRAHIQGRRRRWKIRTRRYLDSGLGRLELKTKSFRRRTAKSAMEIGPDQHGALDARGTVFVENALRQAYGMGLPSRPLRPSLEVFYRRITLADRAGTERLTIDFDLRLRDPAGNTLAGSAPGTVLVETKSGAQPGLADAALRTLGVTSDRYSKYCSGMMLAHPEHPFPELRPVIKRLLRVRPGSMSSGVGSGESLDPQDALEVGDRQIQHAEPVLGPTRANTVGVDLQKADRCGRLIPE
jgi:hypothetical protein